MRGAPLDDAAGYAGAPKKDMLFLGPQGAPIIRRFLVNNILFVLLIHFRYPLIDQKTQKETENS